ncbi:MAG: hypothetical protein L0Z62_00645 [Gemmataceae bacterium]|nr:hypothetical protein [Gemmataceae bacterium]
MPLLSSLDPEEYRRRLRIRPYWEPLELPDREGILPDPSNGRELVDRVVAQQGQGQLLAAPATPVARAHRVTHPQHIAPNFVLPLVAGG